MEKFFIYGHRCKSTGKWYVGQTFQKLEKRFGKDGNNYRNNNQPKFENAIKKYGWDDFDHFILEECTSENVDEREIFWISEKNSYVDGYNSTLGGERLSESCKIPVVKIDPISGDVLKIYDSAVDAAIENGLYNGSCISACCNKKLKSSSGYCWCYLSELENFELPEFSKRIYTHKIAKIDPLTNRIVDVYDSPTQAGIMNNIKNINKNIHRISKNENSKIGGWKWKFLDEKTVRYE